MTSPRINTTQGPRATDFNALGGADRLTANDSGTDPTEVQTDLAGQGGR